MLFLAEAFAAVHMILFGNPRVSRLRLIQISSPQRRAC
jgi:hypothetical protein